MLTWLAPASSLCVVVWLSPAGVCVCLVNHVLTSCLVKVPYITPCTVCSSEDIALHTISGIVIHSCFPLGKILQVGF